MNDRFSELASKIFSSEASEKEMSEFRILISENPELQIAYNQLKEYWDADVRDKVVRDEEQIEDQIMKRIKSTTAIATVRLSSLRIVAAAAILFFITTSALIMYMVSNDSSRNVYTYIAQSVPIEYLLSDGSKVTLNKNSSITINSNFGDEYRNVKLEGEGYFVVTKDKSRPFVVETKGTKTEVLGTIFNVKSKDTNVITTLVEGAVMFTSNDCKAVLQPNEELMYNLSTSEYSKYVCDVQMNTAWVSGRYNYSGIPFGTFVDKLEEIYDIKINVEDSKLTKRIVSASFLIEAPIQDILDAVKEDLRFTYVIDKNNQIEITKK